MNGVSSTASIAMGMQSLGVKQNASILMIKQAAEQQQALVNMLAESTASVTATRGNLVNIVA